MVYLPKMFSMRSGVGEVHFVSRLDELNTEVHSLRYMGITPLVTKYLTSALKMFEDILLYIDIMNGTQ
jgi:hypothetical protein